MPPTRFLTQCLSSSKRYISRVGKERRAISPKKRSPRNAKNKRNRGECPVTIGNEYEVEINEILPNGEGLAAIKGFSIFVPKVKVGDKVTVRVTTVDSVSADAEVVI